MKDPPLDVHHPSAGAVFSSDESVWSKGASCVFQEAEKLVATVIPKHLADAAPEVAVYLKESVGNSTRIDYGTGTRARVLVEA